MKRTKPNNLRAHVVKYASNKEGGEYWTWWLTNGEGSMLCKGPLGFRSSAEATAAVKMSVATIATGHLIRRALLLDA